MSRRFALAIAALAFTAAGTAHASFLPDNNLDKEDRLDAKSGITQAQFNAVIDHANTIFKPIIAHFGGTLVINPKWTDATVNADSSQSGRTWTVNMYGGLARRAEVTVDGFALVLCHELGHHLGGYPFVESWAADEGQADTFAVGACARLIWTGDAANAAAAATVNETAQGKCDATYTAEADRDLCYRTMNGSKSLADLLGALGGDTVSFDTTDPSEVRSTDHDHPAAQCRLDTYVAGSLCKLAWDKTVIPGKGTNGGTNNKAAQTASGAYYCQDAAVQPEALRPRCWFKPL